MGRMIAVFSFEEPTDDMVMGVIISTLKESFQDFGGVRSHLAKGLAAEYVMEFFQTGKEVRSPLVEHAKRELSLVTPDEEDDGWKESIVKAVQGFVSYGHSGGSAETAIAIINDLLHAKNITPLTNDSSEWIQHAPDVWQSRRNAQAFSEDGGVTYYLVNEEPRVIYTADTRPTPVDPEG